VKPYFKRLRAATGAAPRAAATSWDVPALCAAYDWPNKSLAGGGIIAIIELGGGWTASDMTAFFHRIDQPMPDITDVSVDGTTNTPDPSPDSADGEVALDIQVAAAAYYCATGHAATIRVYWAKDIAPAIAAAAHDGCDVCSISWGSDEANWGKREAHALEKAALAATAAGMVVFAASGDNDSADGGPTPANVDLPASAPHVIGCGGTMKPHSGDETVWNDNPGQSNGEGTGGGFSTMFPMPSWQIGARGPGRLVPDVAADADPSTGYNIYFHGSWQTIGGTSAVAPLYTGLFAAFGKKLGFVTPDLWSHPTCFGDVTKGDNGAFRAGVGPDACTGLGSPIASRLATLLTHPVANLARRVKSLEEANQELRAENTRLATGTRPPSADAYPQVLAVSPLS
jgi:kumamolisin